MTKEDLRERLFVAEKVMKSLFQRNKELELKAEINTQIPEPEPCSECERIKKESD